ncbi:glycosyltransferase family 2 protein [Aestuariivivens sediminis]|uniref:glycosyltransferase family 2 protein n=1 Tax=Aestuariivivens sediminis TaxID=2913557 RepID=UPI001F599418|nr:glycosyltransferase [Aestuariivivens sediminis]
MIKPLVSICIPTFNGATYIAETMESALAQTYTNLEIVVSDDASKDDTLEIVEGYKAKTKTPIYIYHHQPRGIGANWNHCVKQAKGKYIKFLFQDDVLLPICVEEMVKVIESKKGLGLVACKREFIISFENETSELQEWLKKYGDLQKNIAYYKQNDGNAMVLDKSIFKSPTFLMSPLNKIGEPTTFIFRKNLIDKVGWFREDLKQVLDYEFCNRILKQEEIVIINVALCKFRLHSNQATQLNKGKDAADYTTYFELIENDYFWYLGRKKQLQLLRKRYRWLDKVFRLKSKLWRR